MAVEYVLMGLGLLGALWKRTQPTAPLLPGFRDPAALAPYGLQLHPSGAIVRTPTAAAASATAPPPAAVGGRVPDLRDLIVRSIGALPYQPPDVLKSISNLISAYNYTSKASNLLMDLASSGNQEAAQVVVSAAETTDTPVFVESLNVLADEGGIGAFGAEGVAAGVEVAPEAVDAAGAFAGEVGGEVATEVGAEVGAEVAAETTAETTAVVAGEAVAGTVAGAVTVVGIVVAVAQVVNMFAETRSALVARAAREAQLGASAFNEVIKAIASHSFKDALAVPMSGPGIFGTGHVGDALAAVIDRNIVGDTIMGFNWDADGARYGALSGLLHLLGYNGGILYPLDILIGGPGGVGTVGGGVMAAVGMGGQSGGISLQYVQGAAKWKELLDRLGDAVRLRAPKLAAHGAQQPTHEGLVRKIATLAGVVHDEWENPATIPLVIDADWIAGLRATVDAYPGLVAQPYIREYVEWLIRRRQEAAAQAQAAIAASAPNPLRDNPAIAASPQAQWDVLSYAASNPQMNPSGVPVEQLAAMTPEQQNQYINWAPAETYDTYAAAAAGSA